jgi:hypothetical protein
MENSWRGASRTGPQHSHTVQYMKDWRLCHFKTAEHYLKFNLSKLSMVEMREAPLVKEKFPFKYFF